MKKLGIIGVCTTFCMVLSAQIKTVPMERLLEHTNPELCADSAALSFEFRELDTPALSEDSGPVCLEFPFKNVSDREIRIRRVTTSCSCVSVVLTQEVIAPGQESSITAVYRPAGHPGKFQRQVFVYTSASEKSPAAVLRINADVAWKTGPEAEYPFVCGNLRLRRNSVEISSKPENIHIRCLNIGSGRLTITAETAMVPFPVTFHSKPETIAPGEEAVLVIQTQAEPSRSGEFPLILKGTGARPSDSTIMIKKNKEI